MINKETWDIRGVFRDGVIFTQTDVERAVEYTRLLQARFLNPLEQARLLMIRTQLAPIIEKEYV